MEKLLVNLTKAGLVGRRGKGLIWTGLTEHERTESEAARRRKTFEIFLLRIAKKEDADWGRGWRRPSEEGYF